MHGGGAVISWHCDGRETPAEAYKVDTTKYCPRGVLAGIYAAGVAQAMYGHFESLSACILKNSKVF